MSAGDVRDDARLLLEAALPLAARWITLEEPMVGEGKVREPHMQPLMRQALGTALGDRDADVRGEYTIHLADWPKVGRVDLALLRLAPRTGPVLTELKWESLANCVWDLAKLGLALHRSAGTAAYLVAGASTEAWATARGSTLLTTRRWDTQRDLLDGYADLWAFWRRDVKTRPLRLPARIATEYIVSTPVPLVAGDWEIRAAEVTVSDKTLIDVPDPDVGGARL